MMNKRYLMRIFLALVLGALAYSYPALALDAPHDAIECTYCHNLQGAQYPRMLGKLCEECHFQGGPATARATHSSRTTDAGYGNWDLDCWACHDPHLQRQDRAFGTTYGKFIKNRLQARIKEINPADPGPYYPATSILRWVSSYNVEYKSQTEFVDGDGDTADDICQVCHENTTNYNTSTAINTHTDYGTDSQPGGNCTTCHDHGTGFSASGASCIACHASTQGATNYRRQVTNTGGDFERYSHHVTDGTTTEIVAQEDCQVCHNQGQHTSNGDPTVYLNDPDLGAGSPITYDGTGASVEGFCLKCHDAFGPLAYDVDSDPTDGYQPFTDNKDVPDIDTDWTGASHNATSGTLFDEACLSCHGGADSTVTETVTDHNVHGSANSNMLSGFVDGTNVTNTEEQLCFACHTNGGSASTDIEAAIATSRTSYHPVASYSGTHDAAETEASMSRHVECQDCHNPHAADNTAKTASPTTSPDIDGTMKGLLGIDADGVEVAATLEYQVCFRCHADNPNVPAPAFPRVVATNSLRAKFNAGLGTGDYATANPSHHAVEAPGVSGASDMPSLINGYTSASVIYCTDCHTDSAGTGIHGSDNPFLLKDTYYTGPAPYDDGNLPNYSASNYNLCWQCHDEASIRAGDSFGKHDKHLNGAKSPCSVCHDPHGVHGADATAIGDTNLNRDNSHLINFRIDTNANTGNPIVELRSGQRWYQDTGNQRGECQLRCHSKDHNPKSY